MAPADTRVPKQIFMYEKENNYADEVNDESKEQKNIPKKDSSNNKESENGKNKILNM